uniref:Uncharacterized protein n=1 Tax=Leersia perrieri TaxID=77586 RepID=A0A0D9XRG8_9ORYZ
MTMKTMVLYFGLAVRRADFLPMMQLTDEVVYAVTIDPTVHKQFAFTATIDRMSASSHLSSHRSSFLLPPPPPRTNREFFLTRYLDLVR